MFRGDRHAGWEDIFSTVLASSTILASGNRIEDLELSAGLMQRFAAQFCHFAVECLESCEEGPRLLAALTPLCNR
jgi:hypothetical protein